ncbi:MAG: hypothetical protein H6754_06195 [Candidatus Omnitrophica bacterium]|nr:hypothetical protein [Candidatus Omnitrophota bacterium]
MLFSPKLKSHRGQSGLEYMALAVFVMTGILIGGPYVVRGINSNFKVIEEGAVDAQREDIRQAPDVPLNLPVCDCTDLIDSGCGDGSAFPGCAKTQKVFRRSCAPLGCEVDMINMHVFAAMSECRDDPSPTSVCCEAPQSTGQCGILGINAPGGRCPDGQMQMRKMCGSPVPIAQYYCEPNPICVFDCETPSANSSWCDPANYNKNLTGVTPVAYTATGQCDAFPDKRCRVQCDPNYDVVGASCLYVDPCEPKDIAYYSNSAVNAGGSATYSSNYYIPPAQFRVTVWTEDLNFQFKVDNGPVQGQCCGYKDSNGDINYASFNVSGSHLWVQVIEGGHSGSGSIGYDVKVTTNCGDFDAIPPQCPDWVCNGTETCTTCPTDCGWCPIDCVANPDQPGCPGWSGGGGG